MKVTFERVIPNEKAHFARFTTIPLFQNSNGNTIIIPKLSWYVSFPGVEPVMWVIIKAIIPMVIWF
jgi:hypothetical protein